ncbi:DUF4286 family protein [Flavobacterium rhizosphaerae]|uniref:DUF4286 family protein n=1 Tax=Flavobacterium rhizosphaerae TaxID=3163298 RepID=A0ABW8YV75_9FLAO
MIIYNITSSVEKSIHDEWMNWMLEDHIPKVMETGKFYEIRIIKVRGDEAHGDTTYSIQYMLENQEQLNDYYKNYAPALRNHVKEKFGQKVLQFRTELEIVKVVKPV